MGYTTEFAGAINLSRKLTLQEAKELVDLNENGDSDAVAELSGVNTYMQWVPAESLDAIVWDGGEKFYDYLPLLKWLCGTWLKDRGIEASGELIWRGDEVGDTGRISVAANVVTSTEDAQPVKRSVKPLTSRRLGEMAIELLSAAGQVGQP